MKAKIEPLVTYMPENVSPFGFTPEEIGLTQEETITLNIYYICRVGEKYLCTKGLDKSLEGVEFMYMYIGDSIDTFNKLCDYLNNCESIDPHVWASIHTRNPNVPKEISDDHISLQRHMKIKNILSK